jgi:hypothetical protein
MHATERRRSININTLFIATFANDSYSMQKECYFCPRMIKDLIVLFRQSQNYKTSREKLVNVTLKVFSMFITNHIHTPLVNIDRQLHLRYA